MLGGLGFRLLLRAQRGNERRGPAGVRPPQVLL